MHLVPFYEYPRAFLDDREKVLKVIDRVASKGAFIMQAELREFEGKLASYCGSAYAIGVANATDGLELAWMAHELSEGDEVIVSAHTMLATASAIKIAGGVPVPVGIGLDGLIDPDQIESAITDKTVGISPTHLNGRTCDMEKIMAIAARHSLIVIEDAAQALGSTWDGQGAGTFGAAAAISFYPAKVLGCLGDGGAILVQEFELYKKLLAIRDHGRDQNGDVICWGRNSRLDNVQAAVLDMRLEKYPEVIARRRELAGLYDELLSSVPMVSLDPSRSLTKRSYDIYQNYEIRAKNRDALKAYLSDNGIGTLIQWGGVPVHQFKQLGFNQDLPAVDEFFTECLMLPLNTFISFDDVRYVCKKVVEFYETNS